MGYDWGFHVIHHQVLDEIEWYTRIRRWVEVHSFDPHLLAEWVVVDVDVDSRAQVELLEKQVLSQSSLGGKMDALTVQVATQAMVGAKVEAAGLQLMKRTMA